MSNEVTVKNGDTLIINKGSKGVTTDDLTLTNTNISNLQNTLNDFMKKTNDWIEQTNRYLQDINNSLNQKQGKLISGCSLFSQTDLNNNELIIKSLTLQNKLDDFNVQDFKIDSTIFGNLLSLKNTPTKEE